MDNILVSVSPSTNIFIFFILLYNAWCKLRHRAFFFLAVEHHNPSLLLFPTPNASWARIFVVENPGVVHTALKQQPSNGCCFCCR